MTSAQTSDDVGYTIEPSSSLHSKIVLVWIDWFCVRYDWWRRLQPTSSVSPVWRISIHIIVTLLNTAPERTTDNGGVLDIPDSNVYGAYIGPTWGQQDPGGPHVGPMNLVIWDCCQSRRYQAQTLLMNTILNPSCTYNVKYTIKYHIYEIQRIKMQW